jgi:four helix bundle protein
MQNVKVKMQKEDVLWDVVEEGTPVYNIRHRCFYFSKDIISFVRSLRVETPLQSIPDQLVRSATSIGANVVEGRAGSSKKDLVNYLTIALKSANETKYWLCLLKETVKLDADKATALIREADEISKIIAAIIINAKQSA